VGEAVYPRGLADMGQVIVKRKKGSKDGIRRAFYTTLFALSPKEPMYIHACATSRVSRLEAEETVVGQPSRTTVKAIFSIVNWFDPSDLPRFLSVTVVRSSLAVRHGEESFLGAVSLPVCGAWSRPDTQHASGRLFIIALRETLEAAIIVSVLLALVEQIVVHVPTVQDRDGSEQDATAVAAGTEGTTTATGEPVVEESQDVKARERRLIRKLRIMIFAGAGIGLIVALSIGAAFIAVFYTTLSDIWSKSEDLWEGIFSLIAWENLCMLFWGGLVKSLTGSYLISAIIIFLMGITMMKIDRAKWELSISLPLCILGGNLTDVEDTSGRSSWKRRSNLSMSKVRENSRCRAFTADGLLVSDSFTRLLARSGPRGQRQ
jgi:hypothetical protein